MAKGKEELTLTKFIPQDYYQLKADVDGMANKAGEAYHHVSFLQAGKELIAEYYAAGLWTNFDLNGPGPVGEPEPARAPANLLFAPF